VVNGECDAKLGWALAGGSPMLPLDIMTVPVAKSMKLGCSLISRTA
jgi:hypothetical protein